MTSFCIPEGQFIYPVVLSGLVNQAGHLLPYLRVVRQAGAVAAIGGFWRGGGAVGLSVSVLLPRSPGAVGGGVLRTAGPDDEAASLSDFQGIAFVAAHPNGWGLRCYDGGIRAAARMAAVSAAVMRFFVLVIRFSS